MCVFNRAIGPMEMARKTRELLTLSLACSWFWSVRESAKLSLKR